MKSFLFAIHLQATAKSVTAAIGGVVAILAAFHWLSPDAAAAITTGVVPIVALLIPDRTVGANPPTTQGDDTAAQ